PASTLLPLQHLSSQPVGTKVRFLGCIRAYDHTTATLTLTHPPKVSHRAEVNISVPLPMLAMGSLKDGQWVNIIGYITEAKITDENQEGVARVDAITLWSAGRVSPSKYCEVLESRLRVE
ncbi:CST complex subunit Ten1, partial [Trichophaea hybrida]